MINGSDRNGDGWLADRPDISNPNAPPDSRPILWTTAGPLGCATGYRNPDTNLCVSPTDVRWVEGTGFPNLAAVGRNTLHTGGTNNFDASPFRTFTFANRGGIEFRREVQNALNHPQLINVPPYRDVVNSPAGRFLNRDFTDSGVRTMWVQVKLLF